MLSLVSRYPHPQCQEEGPAGVNGTHNADDGNKDRPAGFRTDQGISDGQDEALAPLTNAGEGEDPGDGDSDSDYDNNYHPDSDESSSWISDSDDLDSDEDRGDHEQYGLGDL